MSRLSPALLLAVSAAALPALTGCGSSNSDNATAGTNPPKPTTTTTAAAAAKPAAADGAVKVALSEWKVAPSATTAKAGKVTFDVTNTGQLPHEMVVIKTDKPADKLGTGNRISEKGSVGEAGDVAAGKTKTVTLKLKPGHYALVCNVAGHYMSGMHADFTVQ